MAGGVGTGDPVGKAAGRAGTGDPVGEGPMLTASFMVAETVGI